jgi:hypothetical protein
MLEQIYEYLGFATLRLTPDVELVGARNESALALDFAQLLAEQTRHRKKTRRVTDIDRTEVCVRRACCDSNTR